MGKKIILIGVFFLGSFSVLAQTAPPLKTPHLLHFQSILTDAAGVPLSDGIHTVRFRLLNTKGEILYEEEQSLESRNGVVSSMVGAQSNLETDLLDPREPKFLGVKVQGQGPETQLEIVSVPYSLYAEQALTVMPQSVDAEGIKPKSITPQLLSDDFLQTLFAGVTPQTLPPVLISKQELQSSSGAQQIGAPSNFSNSSGGNVQTVLQDLDGAVQRLRTPPAPAESPPPAPFTRVVAAGFVYRSADSESDPRALVLQANYQISRVVDGTAIDDTPEEIAGPMGGIAIYFASEIATPYLVQITPIYFNGNFGVLPQAGNEYIGLGFGRFFAHSFSNNRFVLSPNCNNCWQIWQGVHFLVYK